MLTAGGDEKKKDHEARKLSMRLLDRDDRLFDPTSREAYEEYMESYTDWSSNTQGRAPRHAIAGFLKEVGHTTKDNEGLC